MGTDAGFAAPLAAEPVRRPATLTRRASLTAVASLLDYSVKAIVQLIITPILVGGLGRSLYGMWEMLGRLIGYMAAADGRPTEALRLVIAQQQGADDAVKRRSVGAALAVWILMLPLVAVVGGALAWLAPSITHAPEASRTAVRLTCALLVVSFIFTGLAAVPESVLRGMNLGYKRMGLQAALSIIVGALAAWVVKAGFGLPGMGASQIARAFITGVVFWVLVRKYVPWFRVGKPTRDAIKSLFGMSVWLSAGDLVAKLLLASDVLILGWIISPAAVTTYVLTGYAARTGLGVFVFTAGAAMPGLGGVLGERKFASAVKIRHELRMLTWLFTTVIGATILVWNHSFLHLWVGSRNYAGPWVDLLIVCVVLQTAFIRTDSYIIDAALRPRARVLFGAVTVVATLALGILLTHALGIAGICLGLLAGRAIQSVSYPLIVHSCLQKPKQNMAERLAAIRMALMTALLFAAANIAGRTIVAPSWPVWIGGVALSFACFAAVTLFFGPTPGDRRVIIGRVRTMVAGLRHTG
ncbi:MAG TPA: oligosaccharide flippase family protein [Gemmatimonadales bacterium]|jgi:O-antigen/teichoic acid export membrane protein|nr:oligosaccharide flippase family protein [Gemmatimonadales bacterium]